MIRLNQSSFSADLDDIDRWLQALGFHQRDRLRVYRANIAEMVTRERATNPKQLFTEVQGEGRLGEILSSYAEGIELVVLI